MGELKMRAINARPGWTSELYAEGMADGLDLHVSDDRNGGIQAEIVTISRQDAARLAALIDDWLTVSASKSEPRRG